MDLVPQGNGLLTAISSRVNVVDMRTFSLLFCTYIYHSLLFCDAPMNGSLHLAPFILITTE